MVEVGLDGGVTDAAELAEAVDTETAAVFVQNPNFLGAVEDLEALAAVAKEAGALTVAAVDPLTLGVLRPPGECGVDIAVGEGQSMGGRLDFGGPSFGFFAASEEHLRRMPGRIAGETTDADGRRGFVLALQTREQHIRREKATHNICTSQALNALGGVIYLAWLGRQGIVELGELMARRTAYARERLAGVEGVELLHEAPVVREFAVRLDAPVDEVLDRSQRRGSPPAIRSAASTPSTRTACSWRSPSAARRRTSTAWRTRSAPQLALYEPMRFKKRQYRKRSPRDLRQPPSRRLPTPIPPPRSSASARPRSSSAPWRAAGPARCRRRTSPSAPSTT